MMTLTELKERAVKNCAESKMPLNLYASVGNELNKMPLTELIKFYKNSFTGAKQSLRNYLEEQIILAVVNQVRYETSKG